MRIYRYLQDGRAVVGIEAPGGVVTAGEHTWEAPRGKHAEFGRANAISDLALLPVIEPSAKIICVGLNYRDHAAEAGAEIPKSPMIFAKFSNTLAADGAEIVIPVELTKQVDYEAELGVVIGRQASRVSVAGALDHVLGLTCVNDVSARDIQFADVQWVRGKSVDTFCPVGPSIVTLDEIGDIQNLRVRCIVNGDVLQDASTNEMIFSVAHIVSFLSQTITLEPGDLICTGTPAGVGVARNPQRFLVPGDEVVIDIAGVGSLRNPVTERADTT